jgi:prephenate dehydrogenase
MEESDFRLNITVVGLGLIGASFAAALREVKPSKIYGIDVDRETLEKALSLGIIDEGYQLTEDVLSKSDLVIIALYPEETMAFLSSNAEYFKRGCVITDTCGVKKDIVFHAESVLPDYVEFVGGHPMAGNEFKGINAASEELFKGTNYIITPHERNTEKNLVLIEKLAFSIGCSNVIRVTAEEHDNIISYTSQLPHIIAVSMMNMSIWDRGINSFIGGSLKDTTRVACLNKELWKQVFNMNAMHIIERIEEMEAILTQLKKVVSSKDDSSLERIFDNAIIRKRKIT